MRVPTSQSLVGRLLRLPLKVIPGERPLRVIRGPLRGSRWIPAAGVHGCWLGTFERYEQDLIARLVKPGEVFFDLGANVGFYTLLAARLVGPTGRVVAFEPVTRNVGYLRRHLDLNACSNVDVLVAAVGDRVGTASFQVGVSHSEGRVATDGAPGPDRYPVQVVSLNEMVSGGKIPVPQILKINVEGAEHAVLRGAQNLLRRARPRILLSTHSALLRQQCVESLAALDYEVRPMTNSGACQSELYCVPQPVGSLASAD